MSEVVVWLLDVASGVVIGVFVGRWLAGRRGGIA